MKSLMLLSALVALAGCSGASSSAGAACPSEAEVKAALTRYITVDYWSAGQRDIWKIKSVSDFSFGPIRFGSGEKKQTKMGENQTQLFYKDPFGDWVFKTG